MKLILLLAIIVIVVIYFQNEQEQENFGYYPNYLVDAYYPPSNCMETILNGTKCFPWFPQVYYPNYYQNYYYPRYYSKNYSGYYSNL